MLTLALFDLDHTLLDGDTNVLWIEHLIASQEVPVHVRAAQQDFMGQYAREELDIVDYTAYQLRLLQHRTWSDWQPVIADFVAREIAPRLAPQALDTVQRHRDAGHKMALVTATHSLLAEAIGQHLGLEVIAPVAEVVQGQITGRLLGLPSFREHKIARVQDWLGCELSSPRIEQTYFYSDSANDLPMLLAVSHPVAVNPDARLREVAQAKGWVQLSWRATAREADCAVAL